MTIDSEGHLWVALWKGHRVVRLNTEGKIVSEIQLPTSNITSCCFGGNDLKTIFITTANYNVGAKIDLGPMAGSIFVGHILVEGMAENKCRIRNENET